ncbi:Nucleotidyltransferase substrate binding domain protein [Corynebacterium ramonii]|uniref:Nucleotidyltransferase substrate binding domain protein n=1 Tax=Corynebacterium ramonii TaxID=3026968 RepID=A0ABM5RQK4_9CORY|nr:putative nucleotidyltransferase substrate binding domain-containing protein [Corynebacterium ramonii]AIU32289.1 Nucleotidyltransferase substrate binding domain protein [Corynebacterium ramonii FRC0011]ESU58336.1 nucleotidyltransferase [Corynebacterium ulcerans NCTC 12077]STC77135.1 Nucleotidyltransferase substrate binding domain protein [Corynebacterium ulcerans]
MLGGPLLHESLTELSELAPQCADTPTARGVLTESQDLVRNAVAHGERPQALVEWFSRLVSDVLHSEGIAEITGGAEIILTGAIGRGDALPSSPIKWLTVGPAEVSTTALDSLLADVGLVTEHTRFGIQPRTKSEWLGMISNADGPELALFADAGSWCLQEVIAHADHKLLLIDAINQRPPALRLHEGLPDKDAPVDVRQDLLYPIIAIARWAGVAAGSTDFSTRRRINAGVEAGFLSQTQADFLRQAWESGLDLQFRRWTDRVHSHKATVDSLPAIQRSIFGASSRMVADVARALAADHNVQLV